FVVEKFLSFDSKHRGRTLCSGGEEQLQLSSLRASNPTISSKKRFISRDVISPTSFNSTAACTTS
ncbi:unnamed protein product, partial [Linum tenue]